MTTFADLPIDQVRLHPRNVRRRAVADDELVASIKAVGVLEPVVVGPADADGIRDLITGNRRYDGCLKAGKTSVPAVIRDDLATEAQQVEAMLVENLNREGLTAVEEAEGYEQLQLFGMDESAIAAATGRSKATVKSRLRLNDLPSKAREQLHAGEATLVDAEALLEFANDHEVMAALESSLGTSDFKWRVQNARDARVRAARNAAVVEGFKELGAVEADEEGFKRLTSFWTKELQEADGHTEPECLGYTPYEVSSYQSPVLVCLAPEYHDAVEAETRGNAQTSSSSADVDWEARRAEIAKKNAERLAGSKVRVDRIAGVLRAALPAKGKHAATLAGATRAFLPGALISRNLEAVAEPAVLNHALNVETSSDWREAIAQRAAQAATLATEATDGALLDALAGVLASLIDVVLSTESDGANDAALADVAWDWLTSTGFVPADVDLETRAAVTAVDEPDDDEGDD